MRVILQSKDQITFQPFKDIPNSKTIQTADFAYAFLINLFLSIFCTKPAYIKYKDSTQKSFWFKEKTILDWIGHYKPNAPLPKGKAAIFAAIERICAEQFARNNDLKLANPKLNKPVINSNSNHLESSFESDELSQEDDHPIEVPEIELEELDPFKNNKKLSQINKIETKIDQKLPISECFYTLLNQEFPSPLNETIQNFISSFTKSFNFSNVALEKLSSKKQSDPKLLFLPFKHRASDLFQSKSLYQSVEQNKNLLLIFLTEENYDHLNLINEIRESFPHLEKDHIFLGKVRFISTECQILEADQLLNNIKNQITKLQENKTS